MMAVEEIAAKLESSLQLSPNVQRDEHGKDKSNPTAMAMNDPSAL